MIMYSIEIFSTFLQLFGIPNLLNLGAGLLKLLGPQLYSFNVVFIKSFVI